MSATAVIDTESLRGLVELAPDAMLVMGPGGLILLANSQIEKLLGYRPDEVLGRPVEFLIPDRFKDSHAGFREGYAAQPRRRPRGRGGELFADRLPVGWEGSS